MSVINVPRPLVSFTNPTEGQFDTMRTYLLNFFNNPNLDSNNLADGAFTYSSLTAELGDDEEFGWADAYMFYDNANDDFSIVNEVGDIVFGFMSGSNIVESARFKSNGSLEINKLMLNTSKGFQGVSMNWLLSRYRKPRLVYVDGSTISLEQNGPNGEVLVYGRDRLWSIVDNTLAFGSNANGETSGDTGAAVSGLLQGESRTANRWYYIYAVEVQYGTNSNGINAILVGSVTSPLPSNITTLNSAFGTGKWVYMGVVRNGYNDGTNTNVIIPFKYDDNGYLRFTNATASEGIGMTLNSGTGTTNLEYTLDISNNDADSIPPTATRLIFSGYRSSHGMEFHYRNISTDENHMISSSCYHLSSLSAMVAQVRFEVPLISGYKLVVVIGNASTNRRITLCGLLDHLI